MIGQTIRHIREMKRMTQEELALKADMDRSQHIKIEKGERNPTLATLERIANALGYTVTLSVPQPCCTVCYTGSWNDSQSLMPSERKWQNRISVSRVNQPTLSTRINSKCSQPHLVIITLKRYDRELI